MEQDLDNKITSSPTSFDRTEPDRAGYTLTVEEVSALFAAAGVPRNPRSIRRFCQNGELNCMTIETSTSARYLVHKTSVEQLIKQKHQALQFSESRTAPAMTGHSRPEPDASGHDHAPQPQPAREIDERESAGAVKRLEDDLVNLRIDNRAKEQVINMLRDERREMLAQIENVNYRLGAAETQLAQIEAPKVHHYEPRDAAAPDPAVDRIEAVIVPPPASDATAPVALDPEPAAKPQRSFLGRIFG